MGKVSIKQYKMFLTVPKEPPPLQKLYKQLAILMACLLFFNRCGTCNFNGSLADSFNVQVSSTWVQTKHSDWKVMWREKIVGQVGWWLDNRVLHPQKKSRTKGKWAKMINFWGGEGREVVCKIVKVVCVCVAGNAAHTTSWIVLFTIGT